MTVSTIAVMIMNAVTVMVPARSRQRVLRAVMDAAEEATVIDEIMESI